MVQLLNLIWKRLICNGPSSTAGITNHRIWYVFRAVSLVCSPVKKPFILCSASVMSSLHTRFGMTVNRSLLLTVIAICWLWSLQSLLHPTDLQIAIQKYRTTPQETQKVSVCVCLKWTIKRTRSPRSLLLTISHQTKYATHYLLSSIRFLFRSVSLYSLSNCIIFHRLNRSIAVKLYLILQLPLFLLP